jgi:uncharacterized repeat protein (TIGR01451 family)
VVDSLGGALDDVTYQGDLAATAGTVTADADTLTWTGDLALGQTVAVTYSVQVDSPNLGDKHILNSVASDELGSTCPSGSTDPACTTFATVRIPALAISLTADATGTTLGSTVNYTLSISNPGQTAYAGASVNVSVAAALDDATYGGDAVASAGSVSFTSPNLTWTGDLGVGASATVTYSMDVNDPDTGDRLLGSSVSSEAPGATCTLASPCLSSVTVLIPALAISTTADHATATPGDPVRFTVTLTNTGETAYSNTTLTASLADLVDDASFDGLVTASTGTASYAAPNLSWRLTVTVAGQPAGNRQLVMTAVSAAPGSCCSAGASNASCTASVTVLLPKLSIAKSADRATTVPGEVVGYTIVITNDGETAQTGVTVTDSLAGVLPDAAYNGDAVVTGGGVLSYSAQNLGHHLVLGDGAQPGPRRQDPEQQRGVGGAGKHLSGR